MPIGVRKDTWAAEVGRLNGLDMALGTVRDWPLEKPHRIAAALSDSNVSVRVQEEARVRGDVGEFERKMQRAERFLLPWAVPDARERAEAMDHGRVKVRADVDIGLTSRTVTAQADRRRAELRHVSSIGSCSTLLTKIGPAIVSRVAVPFSAPNRVDDQAIVSCESVFAKRQVQKRAFVLRRKCERSQHVSLRAEAEAAVRAGSCGGWQGHLSFICPPFLSKRRSDEVERTSRANGSGAGELGDLHVTASCETARGVFSLAGLPSLLAKLHPDCESNGRVPPNMPHPPLPPNPPTGRPNAPARTHLSS